MRRPTLNTTTATGVRNAYASHAGGATGFYAESGATYTNPHDGGVRLMLAKAVREWPELWAEVPTTKNNDTESDAGYYGGRILDLSCGRASH